MVMDLLVHLVITVRDLLTGLATEEGLDFYGGQLTYTADSYGLSATYANLDAGNSMGPKRLLYFRK